MWREAPMEVRQKFEEQALREKEEHQRKYPGYRYQPVVRRTDIIRRRVRKDQAEDDKVEAVAEALIKGKAGNALEKEIRDQMTTRSEAGDSSDGEGSRATASTGSRRRRREVGQLSKGAIRAQRAQARAKQMRQNLLGSNLLNMSMYNAAQQQQQAQQRQHANAMHPHSHPGMQYAMAENYMPVGYDLDGRPVMPHQYPGEMYPPGAMAGPEEGMYHLPPLEGPGYNLGWQGEQALDPYWNSAPVQDGYIHPEAGSSHPDEYYTNSEYALPPLMEQGPREGVVAGPSINMASGAGGEDADGVDPRMRDWTGEVNQTPSGHVMFSERLFDGLGSAGLGRDDGLAAFDEAMKDAQEVNPW
ncbi:hypothetical protein BCR39DRAFT_254421 [Naematelia encephala]|uniref:HMG box domain-containing protein n=1 Tax=Naematelia encephala TaxID=71784 RepID=A0A1Y2AVL6_9TREE|nr:hypothetical protein BCR39DRAFT_254421 [Naematelia encephala]